MSLTTPNTRSTATSQQIIELKNIVQKLVVENKELKTKVEESLKFTQFASEKYDDSNKLMTEVLEKLSNITEQNKKLIEKNENLEKELLLQKKKSMEMEEQLYKILTPIETERRQNNLELHGLSEENQEDCVAAVKSVLSKISPDPVTIVKCFRLGYKETAKGEKRTRPIFIQFGKKEERDSIYSNRSNLRKLQNRLYLNENLPKYMSELRGKANARRKENQYKFLWTKGGTILVRKDENSKVINIKTPSDLEKIL